MGVRARQALILVGVAVCASAAQARAALTGGASLQATLTEAGGGSLVANAAANPTRTWSWQICDAAGEACAPYASGQSIKVGTPPAGVTFKAIASDGPVGLSPVWNGPLHAAAPPSVAGAVRANELVTPMPAAWGGGWTGDYPRAQLSACPTTAGTGCITLTGNDYDSDCPNGGALLDPDFTGWYLQVASVVYGPNTVFAENVTSTRYGLWPYARDAWQAGPTIAVAVVARIEPATGLRTTSCGPPPLVSGLPPQVAIGVHSAKLARDGTATVQCLGVCAVDLHASARGRVVRATSSRAGETRLRIPTRALAHLGRGPIRYTLFVDGYRAAQTNLGC